MMNLNVETIRELYWDKSLTVNEIADFLGVGRTTVRRFMKRNGIPIRSIYDAMLLARKLGRFPQLLGQFVGDKNPNWHGGRYITKYGYVRIKIYPDNPFYSMADNLGYIAEHRLVMAQYLGRPLESWEQLHHRPPGDKTDNRYENLLLTTNENHFKEDRGMILRLQEQIKGLQSRVTQLEAESVLLQKRLKGNHIYQVHPFYEEE